MCVWVCVCLCAKARLTYANNPLDMNIANIYFLGKLMDGLIRVLIRKRVHIDFDSFHGREAEVDKKRGRRWLNEEEGEKNELYNCMLCKSV